jgi:arsenate reductase
LLRTCHTQVERLLRRLESGVSLRENNVAASVYNVLFLCTGNAARSLIAEALLDRLGQGRFRAFSAGSHPAGRVHPFALRVLEERGLPTAKLRSKSWDEFASGEAPVMNFVFTVCDKAAG